MLATARLDLMQAVEALLETPLFKRPVHGLSPDERMPVTVAKAQKVADAYGVCFCVLIWVWELSFRWAGMSYRQNSRSP